MSASAASMGSAEKSSSLARPAPIRRGKRWVPPAPATVPIRALVMPKRAESAATRMSQERASSRPPVRHHPAIAAITGFGQRSIAALASRKTPSARWVSATALTPARSSRSMPVEKQRSLPRRTTTRTVPSSPRSRTIDPSRSSSSRLRALCLAGRLRVTRATSSRCSTSSGASAIVMSWTPLRGRLPAVSTALPTWSTRPSALRAVRGPQILSS